MSKQHWDIVIIGAGASGLGAAMRLLKAGFTDFVILEKNKGLGGTWRDNTYPGCACDVPSALYSYSFAQKKDWSRTFAGQKEILQYLQKTSEEAGILPFINFETTVENSNWNESQQCWELETSSGNMKANKIIMGVGYLHEPIIPDLPGIDSFNGELFHSSQWDHECDMKGKRVAVIGTGASAIQFIPQIQPDVSELHVFQRTAQWILPKPDYRISAIEKMFYRLPFTLGTLRNVLYNILEIFGIGFRKPSMLKRIQKIAEAHIKSKVKDKELRKKLTPDYTLGCKRVLFSNNYYQSLTKDNVDVYHTGVKEIRGNTVVGQDGSETEVDIIILGTGFHVSDASHIKKAFGRDGRSLDECWQGSPEAYKGTCIHNFPNVFVILGPNLAIGNNSAFIVIEAQLNYIIDAMETMKHNKLQTLEVKAEFQKQYNETVQNELQTTVWNAGGCSSYYLDKNGKNSIGFPWSSNRMKKILNTFDIDAYNLQKNQTAES